MKNEDELKKLVKTLPKGLTHGDFVRLERVYRQGTTKLSPVVRKAVAEPMSATHSVKSLRCYYKKNSDLGDEEWDANMLIGYWCFRYHEMYDGDCAIDGVRDTINEMESRSNKLTSTKIRRGIDAVFEATTEEWWSGGAPKLDLILSPERWSKFVAPRLNKKPKKRSGEQAEWSGERTKTFTSKRII